MQSFNLLFYQGYKILNSLFLGVSLGTIFVIYQSLPQETYSLGGIALAIGSWILTLFYTQILQERAYKVILLGIEIIPFFYLGVYLIAPDTFYGAIVIYVLYQITFIFGGYLVRCETLIFEKSTLATLDRAKQVGYLLGLGIAFLFYYFLEGEKTYQVYYLHFLLLFIQSLVLIALLFSYKR
ncbi:MAG: hypothetical protein J1E31_02525 [Helicobacter sp.]|nr:hypothetical protein [Helicobacter sp.]